MTAKSFAVRIQAVQSAGLPRASHRRADDTAGRAALPADRGESSLTFTAAHCPA